MALPRIAIIFTGGTISMLPDPATGAAVPSLDGAGILARIPGLDAIADVETIDWGRVPASHLSFDQLLDIARVVRAALAQPGVSGAVVVQGTDVIEESAFALDLLVPGQRPVVVVGAMRTAADPGDDGPANLRDAVLAAGTPSLAGQGTVVVMGGRILPADDVTKTHTHAYDTFAALNLGPLGTVLDGRVVVARRRAGRRCLPRIPEHAAEPVALVTAVLGSGGDPLRWAIDAGARGIVVAATGAGNTHPDLLAAAGEAMSAGIPIVLTTRAPSGRATPTYGFPGGGLSWQRAGAILAGFLGGPKARIALALGLGAGLDDTALRALFEDPS